ALNEKVVEAGSGATTYGQCDVEVVTYVLEGVFGHEDSMGNAASLAPGDVQRISAGSGVTHSERYRSDSGTARFLQIWIEPDRTGVASSYARKRFAPGEKRGRLRL